MAEMTLSEMLRILNIGEQALNPQDSLSPEEIEVLSRPRDLGAWGTPRSYSGDPKAGMYRIPSGPPGPVPMAEDREAPYLRPRDLYGSSRR